MPQDALFVQYGCGLSAPRGWRNFDASPTLRLQKIPILGPVLTSGRVRFPDNAEYGDVTRRLPIPDQSCDAVYCSHVLEHLSLEDFRKALRETHRILRPMGVFRGVVPDLARAAREYVSDNRPDAAIRFIRSTLMGYESRPRTLQGILASHFGNSHHLWMWDYRALESELYAAGFNQVRRATFNDSEIEAFRAVEDQDRWGDAAFECLR